VEYTEEEDLSFARAVIAANDVEFKLWPAESVNWARSKFIKEQRVIPSIESMMMALGVEHGVNIARRAIQQRKAKNELIGYGSPCHYCGDAIDSVGFDFALMNVGSTKRPLRATLASVAISTITIPLLGVGGLASPSKSHQGACLHLKLIVCKSCCKKEGNMFGLFMLNEDRASVHPYWETLQDAGFTKFLDPEKMPQEFKLTLPWNL
jgi:hypothetical protein